MAAEPMRIDVNMHKRAMFTSIDSETLRRWNRWCRRIEASIDFGGNDGSGKGMGRSVQLHARAPNRGPSQRDVYQLSQTKRRWQSDHVTFGSIFVSTIRVGIHQRRGLAAQKIGQRQFKAEEYEMDV